MKNVNETHHLSIKDARNYGRIILFLWYQQHSEHRKLQNIWHSFCNACFSRMCLRTHHHHLCSYNQKKYIISQIYFSGRSGRIDTIPYIFFSSFDSIFIHGTSSFNRMLSLAAICRALKTLYMRRWPRVFGDFTALCCIYSAGGQLKYNWH